MGLENVTAVIPIHRKNGNRDWLQQAINSLGPQVTPLIVENDGELADARNAGLAAATTDYVLFMDADDVAGKDMVHELHAAIWDVDVTYPEMLLVSEDLRKPLGLHRAEVFCPYRLQQGNYISGCSMVRREKALEVGGFRDLPVLEDWDMWVRMMRAGARFKPVPDARLFYRQVEGSRNKNQDIDWAAVAARIIGDGDPTAACPVTFYSSDTPATAYVRCTLPARQLGGLVMPYALDVAFGPNGEHAFVQHRGPAAVFQISASKTGALLVTQMKADGIRTLIETDDNYLSGGASRFRKTAGWGRKVGEAPDSVEGHRWIAGQADGVIVSTRYLANRYRDLNPNVFVCPNQIDPSDWPELRKPDDGVFRIGWFASGSHKGDERLIRRAMEWAAGQPGVEVLTLGHTPLWNFPKAWIRGQRDIPGDRGFTALPWATDLSAYRKAIGVLDVGVAPVIATPFARGRSDLKWLEYSMGGAASVLSNLECYEDVPAGLAVKADDAAGFYRAIRRLVQDKAEARQMGAAAREYVLKERTVEANSWRWTEAITA